jgi:dephospho-CoA kinase
LLHRYIYRAIGKQFLWHFLCGRRVVIYDCPLLFEMKSAWMVSQVVCVATSDDVQMRRIAGRVSPEGDVLSDEDAKKRIAAQMPQADKIARSDRVIVNNASEAELKAESARCMAELAAVSRWDILSFPLWGLLAGVGLVLRVALRDV